MDSILVKGLDEEEMHKVNLCRMTLQCHYIRDLITEDGEKFIPGILKGKKGRESKLRCPEIKVPGTWWKLWESIVNYYVMGKG